jgi:O-antigen ligase
VGALVGREPRFLHLGGSLDLRTVAALLLGLGLSALILLDAGFALQLLAAFVYLNLSQVLVRHHQLPSLLQLLAVPLFLAAWLRRGGDRPGLLTRPLTLGLAAYTLILAVSTLLARDPELADARVAEHVKALAVYLLVALLGGSLGLIRRGVWALLASGALLGAVALTQVVSGDFRNDYLGLGRIKYAQIYGDVFEPRIAGPLGDPNFFAQVLLLLAPLALIVAGEERRPAARAAALAVAALTVGAAVLTYSRGGALALAFVLILTLLARPFRAKQVALGGLALALALAALVPAGFARRLSTIAEVLPGQQEVLHPDSSFEQRRLLTQVAWRIFLDHPLLGVGAGNYTSHFDEYAEEVGSLSREYEELGEQHYPHNLYLEIAAETGLLGLAAFGAAVVACFAALRSARRAALASGRREGAALARGFEIAVAGYLASSLFLHGHHVRYLWMVFGFAAALERACGDGASERPRGDADV